MVGFRVPVLRLPEDPWVPSPAAEAVTTGSFVETEAAEPVPVPH